MALASTVVWEVRPGSGSDTNGGGFDPGVSSPGTDWSQQNSAKYALTNGTTAGTTTILTSSASSDMKANLVYVAGGTGSITGNWYTILSVSVGTSITVDRSTGLTTGTGVTLNIGGALNSLKPPITNAAPSGTPAAVTGNLIWVKASAVITLTVRLEGVNSQQYQLIGYTTTRGDGGQVTITTATNSTQMFDNYAALVMNNFIFSNTAATSDTGFTNCTSLLFDACVFSGFTQAVNCNGNQFSFVNCIIENCTSSSGALEGQFRTLTAIGSLFKGNTGPAIANTNSNNGWALWGCVFYSNGYGLYNDNNGAVFNITAVSCAFVSSTNDGINVSADTNQQNLTLVNCIFSSNGGYGVNGATVVPTFAMGRNNAFYNNTSGARLNFPTLPGDITLTAQPFTNPSGGDFSLNSTSGGGANCTGAGYQSPLI